MDFGNPKELRFFNDLRPVPGCEAFGRGGGGGRHIVTDFVTRVMRPKYLLKKSDSPGRVRTYFLAITHPIPELVLPELQD